MKKTVAIVVLGAILVALAAPAAQAHGHGGSAALALAAFAAFNVLFLPFTLLAAAIPPPAAYPPAYAYSTPASTASTPAYAYGNAAPAATHVAAAPAAPRISREVVYPHGRYLLYGDGVNRAYQWIWVPNPPPPGSAPGY